MFVLILGFAVLALADKYGSGLISSKAARKQLDNTLDWVLFVAVAIFLIGLAGGGS